MEAYIHSKSRWRPSSKTWNHNGRRRCSGKCAICSERAYSRHATKILQHKDLEEEYCQTNDRYRLNSASAFVEWFYARNEDEPPDEAGRNGGVEVDEIVEMFGEEGYQELLREHIEAEKQLLRTNSKSEESQEQVEDDAGREILEVNEETWDVISTTSDLDLWDWERVTVE